jgi:hypothetical protein
MGMKNGNDGMVARCLVKHLAVFLHNKATETRSKRQETRNLENSKLENCIQSDVPSVFGASFVVNHPFYSSSSC